jgi:hypothetical protein
MLKGNVNQRTRRARRYSCASEPVVIYAGPKRLPQQWTPVFVTGPTINNSAPSAFSDVNEILSHSIINKPFFSYIQWLIFLLNGNTMKNTMLGKSFKMLEKIAG